MAPRLDSTARRLAILDTALPLFAQKGFAATTTKEIAQAAGVSEALIFKHFPTKASLYEAIFLACIDEDPDYSRLLSLTPSTASLVQMIQGMVHYLVIEVPADPKQRSRHRLTLISLLEDGEFMRHVYEGVRDRFMPAFTAAVRAAVASGDLAAGPIEAENGLWMAEHLCTTMASVCLSGQSVVPYLCGRPELARQTIWFILRGLGLRDETIAAQEGTARFPYVPFDASSSPPQNRDHPE